MGSPYLNNGEAIILTTNRVSADSVLYDVMLTSERIFFIDNRNARFEPGIIPLNTILSVQGGKTPAQDPAITLLFRTGKAEGGAREPLILVFSQNPNENRKPERDDWVRSLIQLSIRQHERELAPETPVTPEVTGETGLRPTIRHGVAPEMVRPLSKMIDRHTAQVPVTVIPDEVERGEEISARAAVIIPVSVKTPEPVPEDPATDLTPLYETPPPSTEPEDPDTDLTPLYETPPPSTEPEDPDTDLTPLYETLPPSTEPEDPDTDLTPLYETPPLAPAPPARVIIPQIVEELLPARSTEALPGDRVPSPAADSDQETPRNSVQTEIRSPTIRDETSPQPPYVPVTETIPEVPAGETGQERVTVVSPDAAAVVPDVPAPETPQLPVTATIPVVPAGETEQDLTAAVPLHAATGPTEFQAIARPLQTGVMEPGAQEPATATVPSVPEPVPEITKTGIERIPESHVTLTIPENVVQESVGHPAPEAIIGQEPQDTDALPVRLPIPPARQIPPLRKTLVSIAALLLIIAVIAVAVLLLPEGHGLTAGPRITPMPGIVPDTTSPPATVQPTPVPPVTTRITTTNPSPSLMVSVPQSGVWVQVNSTVNYTGSVGNAGFMQPFSGTGNNFYEILWNNRTVQVSVQKQDNSGALLIVGIYRNGTLINTDSVTSPSGTVDMLIDPRTGRAPGLTANDVPASIASQPEIVPGTTSPPATVQPATVPPVTTRITTTSPSPMASVPQSGVWVQVNSTANYTGSVGNAGFMQPFSGSGNNFYKVLWNDRTVQVSVQKQDNSGALLIVGIYQNGTLISTDSVTSPGGTVDMLIDPKTGRAPGLTANDMPVPITTPS